jgi:hypothetical protein
VPYVITTSTIDIATPAANQAELSPGTYVRLYRQCDWAAWRRVGRFSTFAKPFRCNELGEAVRTALDIQATDTRIAAR